jgi:hypothetical protein
LITTLGKDKQVFAFSEEHSEVPAGDWWRAFSKSLSRLCRERDGKGITSKHKSWKTCSMPE